MGDIKPTPSLWERIKPKLKHATLWTAKYALPVALALVTGGAAAPVALAPILEIVKKKLADRHIKTDHPLLGKVFTDIADKTADPTKLLEDFKEKLQDANKDLSPEEIQASVDVAIRPLLTDLKATMEVLQTEITQNALKTQEMTQLLQDWGKSTNSELKNHLQDEFGITRDAIQSMISAGTTALSTQIEVNTASIRDIGMRIGGIQQKLDAQLAKLCGTKLTGMNGDAVLAFCEAYIQRSQFASRYDIPFMPELFEPNPGLDHRFQEFLENGKNPFGDDRRIFLILAHFGMGKTWNAVHLAIQTLQTHRTPVFFFGLNQDFYRQLQMIFGSTDVDIIGKACGELRNKLDAPPLFILDGVDEIPQLEVKVREVFGFVANFQKLYPGIGLFLMTCRLIDWNTFTAISEQIPKIQPFISAFPQEKDACGITLKCEVSMILGQFNEVQLDHAILKYQLQPAKIDPALRSFCRLPFFLRLLMMYLESNPAIAASDHYPSPTNVAEFFPLFTDEVGSYNTILGRMGIHDTIRQLFIRILEEFAVNQTTILEKDLIPVIGNIDNPHYLQILSSGILLKRDLYGKVNVVWNPEYYKLLQELKRRASLSFPIEEPPTKIPPPKQPSEEALKQFQFYRDMGKDALNRQHLEEALQYFQKALPIGTEVLFDFAAVKEINDLIAQTEQAINTPMMFHGIEVMKLEGLVLQALEGVLNKAFNPNSTSAPGFQIDNQCVVRLDLNGLRLYSLPDSIGNLKSLTHLNLNSNLLSSLPDSIGQLKSLTYLNLGSNSFSSLPDSIGNLNSLQTLDISNNKLNSLPKSIGNLTKLEILQLSENKLFSLPDSIGQLKSLTYLNLRSNSFSSLPDSIGNLNALHYLYLNDNKLESLPGSTQNALKNLEKHGCKIFR